MVTRCCIVVSVARVELAGSRSAGRRSSTAAGSIEAQCVRACVQRAVRCLGKCWRVTGTDGCSATRWLVKMHANDARVEPCPSSIDLHSLTLTAITALETRKL
jgi:hypothetical protein